MRLHLLFVFVLCLAHCPPLVVAKETPTADMVKPPDVYSRVGLARADLELIRHVMGRRENQQPEFGVSDAAPREVYFQALTMFRKAERLCFEHTRQHAAEPELPAGTIRPADVLNVVNATLDCLGQVKAKLGIKVSSRQEQREPNKTPTDVFRSIVQANRQLNLLLEHQFAPSDVFQQVTRGIGYSTHLLRAFPNSTTIPEAPVFEPGKTPGDVYRRLLNCFERIRSVAKASGLRVLELEPTEAQITGAEPSDVYDVASLLVSELAYLHSQLANAGPPRDVYYVGRKFPSHVYQRAGILEHQLVELEKWVEEKPDWLDDNGDSP